VVRHRRKIEAIVDNARQMLALDPNTEPFAIIFGLRADSRKRSSIFASASAFRVTWGRTTSFGLSMRRSLHTKTGAPHAGEFPEPWGNTKVFHGFPAASPSAEISWTITETLSL